MNDLTTPVTAEWLWQMAGPDMWLYKWSAEGYAMLQGKGARCMMTRLEFAKYQEMRRQHAETRTALSYRERASAGKRRQMARRHELAGAPVVSMMEATADEEAELEALKSREPSCFARSFREIEQCLLAYARCLSDDERDEIIRQIAGKVMPLKEAVLRAEEIWREENPDAETLRLGDLETEPVCDNCGRPATCLGTHIDAGPVSSCGGCAATQGRDRELLNIRPLPNENGGAA